MTKIDPGTGAEAKAHVKIKGEKLEIKFEGALENTLYTVWVDHRSRAGVAPGQQDEEAMADDYPVTGGTLTDGTFYGPGIARGVAPAFSTTQGVTSGMGLDANGVITDDDGDANFKIKLNYKLLELGASPVVAEDLVLEGANRVGGGWLRSYKGTIGTPSSQAVDADGLPIVIRSTAQGLTIVGHPDFVTHGHTPGVGGTDHSVVPSSGFVVPSSSFSGNFPGACMGS